MIHICALLGALVANAGANILIKASARQAGSDGRGLAQFWDWRFVAGLACFAAALVGYQFALRRFDLSLGYPVMTGGGLILVALASVFLFQEALSPTRLAGLALILVGVVLVSR